eukprot:GHVH01010154.1.p1 GENE.GHVH01010154.1~~GHVH01010154.1.p1  ORF type:complete len:669 (-),score=60.71 GHVH01010154.1:1280-3286(-)
MCCISVLIATQTLLIIMFGICRREEMQLTTEAGGRGHQGGIKLSSKRSILSNLVVGINLVPTTADKALMTEICTDLSKIDSELPISIMIRIGGENPGKRKREIVQNFEDYVTRFGCTGGERIRPSDLSANLRDRIDKLRRSEHLEKNEVVLIKNKKKRWLDIWDLVTITGEGHTDKEKWVKKVDRFYEDLAKDVVAWHCFFETAAKYSRRNIIGHRVKGKKCENCSCEGEYSVRAFEDEHIIINDPRRTDHMVFDLYYILMRFDLFLPTISRLIMENGNLNRQTFQRDAWQVIVSCWGNNFDWTLIEDFLRAILKSLERSNDLLKAFFLQNKEIGDSCCFPCTYREMETVQLASENNWYSVRVVETLFDPKSEDRKPSWNNKTVSLKCGDDKPPDSVYVYFANSPFKGKFEYSHTALLDDLKCNGLIFKRHFHIKPNEVKDIENKFEYTAVAIVAEKHPIFKDYKHSRKGEGLEEFYKGLSQLDMKYLLETIWIHLFNPVMEEDTTIFANFIFKDFFDKIPLILSLTERTMDSYLYMMIINICAYRWGYIDAFKREACITSLGRVEGKQWLVKKEDEEKHHLFDFSKEIIRQSQLGSAPQLIPDGDKYVHRLNEDLKRIQESSVLEDEAQNGKIIILQREIYMARNWCRQNQYQSYSTSLIQIMIRKS